MERGVIYSDPIRVWLWLEHERWSILWMLYSVWNFFVWMAILSVMNLCWFVVSCTWDRGYFRAGRRLIRIYSVVIWWYQSWFRNSPFNLRWFADEQAWLPRHRLRLFLDCKAFPMENHLCKSYLTQFCYSVSKQPTVVWVGFAFCQ